MLHLIGVSGLNSELPFLVFDESLSERCLNTICLKMTAPTTFFFIGTEWAIESIIASALSKGLKQSLLLGLQTVWDLLYSYDNSHCLQGCRSFGANFLNSCLSLPVDRHSVNITALQSGLDYLHTLLYPLASVGLDVSEGLRSGLATEHFVALHRQL